MDYQDATLVNLVLMLTVYIRETARRLFPSTSALTI